MSFLDKLLKRRPKSTKPQKVFSGGQSSISLEKLDEYLSEKTAPTVAGFSKELGAYRIKFTGQFDTLIDLFEKIENQEIKQVVLENKRDITDIIKTSRDNYCQSSKKLLGDVLAHLKSEDDPEALHERLVDTFNKLNNLSRQAQMLLYAFRDDMKKIGSALKEISAELEDFGKFLDKDHEAIKKITNAQQMAHELLEKKAAQSAASKAKTHLEGELDALLKELEKQVAERDEILKSKDYLHYERLKDESEELEGEREDLVRKISANASSVERILKKYLHTNKKLKKSEREGIEHMMKDAERLALNLVVFEEALENAKKQAIKEEKDKKKQKKIEENVRQVLESIEPLVARHIEVDERLSLIRHELKKTDINLLVNEVDTKISDLETRQKNLSDEKTECEAVLSENPNNELLQLEALVYEITNEKIILKY